MNKAETETPLGLFEATGIELEYVIVDRKTLNVLPICDKLLLDEQEQPVLELDRGPTRWSNELALHVIETKTNGPTASLTPYIDHFQSDIGAINQLLETHDAMLMPTGMHPWMNPLKETKLWPHEQGEIYQQFDRIFDCRGHGWTNLQSMHINLPFANDEEFRKLHLAIRMLLPIMPALSASTPVVGGEVTGVLNNRLRFYGANCRRVPEVTGLVIPENVISEEDYYNSILMPMYKAIHQHDRMGILKHEWLNARGAIARFERMAIEIRILDTQECPAADLLIATTLIETLKQLVAGVWRDPEATHDWEPADLLPIYQKVVTHAENAWISNEEYLSFFDYPENRCTAGELWQHILESGQFTDPSGIEALIARGSLANRIKQRLEGKRPAREQLCEVYRELAHCLDKGTFFGG
jgi:gamma-glutamyl:cysteine ligase YbdK (ATP-grasp superfamily)